MRQHEWADKLNTLVSALLLFSCFFGAVFLAAFGAAWLFAYEPGYAVARVLAYIVATSVGVACVVDVFLVNPLYRRTNRLLQKGDK